MLGEVENKARFTVVCFGIVLAMDMEILCVSVIGSRVAGRFSIGR